MAGTQPEKSHKIVIPLIVVAALAGAILGGITGIAVLYILGMLAFIVVLAAAWSSRKSKRAAQRAEVREDQTTS